MSVAAEVARRLVDAYRTGVPVEPIRKQIKGVASAYDVQRETVNIWLRRGRRPVGQKIGLTSTAIQTQLGVGEPDFGTLFADMLLTNPAQVRAGAVLQPRVEAELAFVLSSDLRGERITPNEVIAATAYVVPAIEICGSRIARWDIQIEDTIADNASSGLVVVGTDHFEPTVLDLAGVSMKLEHDGVVCAEGRGEACLGNPATAVAWLATALTRFGDGLRAGDLVMSGALAKMIPAEPGSQFRADFGALGEVSVEFVR